MRKNFIRFIKFTFAPRIIFSPIISPIIPDTYPVYFTFSPPTFKFRVQIRVNIRGLRSTNSTPKTPDSGGIPREDPSSASVQ